MMRVKMTTISVPLAQARKNPGNGPDLTSTFDVIVVGSGYGGAITAAKLAECGKSVLLLERGHEILPGNYPRFRRDDTRDGPADCAQRLGKGGGAETGVVFGGRPIGAATNGGPVAGTPAHGATGA